MKKILAIAAAAALLLSFTACSKKDETAADVSQDSAITSSKSTAQSNTEASDSNISAESSTDNTSKTEPSVETATFDYNKDYSDTVIRRYIDVTKFSDKTKKNVIDPLCSDTCSVSCSAKVNLTAGLSTKASVIYAKDGEKKYIFSDLMSSKTYLKNDSGTYQLDLDKKTAKQIIDNPEESDNDTVTPSSYVNNSVVNTVVKKLLPDFGQKPLTYVQNGAETHNDIPLSYEEYAVGETVIKLYYDGNDLKYISLQKDDLIADVEFIFLKNTADESYFKIPEDFTIEK